MSKFHVHIDKPLPDKEQIAKFKNFDALHARYQTHTRFQVWKNLYRNPRTFAALVAIIAVVFLVFDPSEKSTDTVPTLSLSGSDAAVERLSFAAETGASWSLGAGESLEIPPFAFADSQGQRVQGSVQVEWLALQEPAEIFLQGSKGQSPQQRFMQLRAYQGAQALTLVDTAALYWTLPAGTAPENMLAWDDTAQAWVRGAIQISTAPVGVKVAPTPDETLLALRTAWQQQAGTKSLPPMPQAPERPFGVKLKRPEAHPEFREYALTYWTYQPGTGSTDPWSAGLVGVDRPPQEVRIQKITTDQYRLQFVRMDAQGDMEVIPVIASPVFEARNATQAQRRYQQQLDDWTVAKRSFEAQITAQAQLKRDWEAAEVDFAAKLAQWKTAGDSSQTAPRERVALRQSVWMIPGALTRDTTLIRFVGVDTDSLPQAIWAVSTLQDQLIPCQPREDGSYAVPAQARDLIAFWAVVDSQQIWTARPKSWVPADQYVDMQVSMERHHPKTYAEALATLRRYLPKTP